MDEVAEDGGGCGDDAGCSRGHSAAGSGGSESGGDPGGGTRQADQETRVDRSLHLPAPYAPAKEYRGLSPAEWDEFLGHFELRKVELGVCTRDFGTHCGRAQARDGPLILASPWLPALHAAAEEGATC